MNFAKPAGDDFDEVEEITSSHVLKMIPANESRSPRDTELIASLQAKIAHLQDELARAEKELKNYEQLLRNARQRETELRAQMSK